MDENQKELVAGLMALLTARYGKTDGQAWQWLFSDYDADKDGRISAEELNTLLNDADIGNAFTRSFWVKGIMGKLDLDTATGISAPELLRVLPKAPGLAPTANTSAVDWASMAGAVWKDGPRPTPPPIGTKKGGSGLWWIAATAAGGVVLWVWRKK
jgi:hypothetical protein